jgi:hypothetical protein
MFDFLKKIYKKIKSYLKRLEYVGVGRNILFIIGISCIAYLRKNHRKPLYTSEFIKGIDKSLVGDINILNDKILFSLGNNSYYTNTSNILNSMVLSKLM